MTSCPSTAAPLLPVLAIVLVLVALLGVYAGGYLWLGHSREWVHVTERSFPSQWLVPIFQPAARLEGLVRGIEVRLKSDT